ncbi:MAG: lipid-A-disaccharide synthase [Geminicoccaceae bacterium]
MVTPARIFMLAGEPSGDVLGSRLMRALREQSGDRLRFFGVGGPRMAEQGLTSLFPMDELSLMGFTEVLPHLPHLLGRMRQSVGEIKRQRPDAVVTIDSPGFALRLQRRLARLPLTRVHYVAPQIWAWREQRAARLARDLDHLLALLPFEPPFFERFGVPCSFVGHPIIEEVARPGDGARFRARYDIPTNAPLLCLLPGSRELEVKRHLPVLERAVMLLWRRFPRLRVILPTLGGLAPVVHDLMRPWKVPVVILEERSERFDGYAASWLAIAASGTVSLEVALAGLPLITIYRTGPLTAWLVRRLIRVPHVNLVNLILDRPVVPELLQEDCDPERIAAAAARLIEDDRLRQDQVAALAEAVARLGGADQRPPSQRAAERVLELLDLDRARRTA